jgi:hypothetical protein
VLRCLTAEREPGRRPGSPVTARCEQPAAADLPPTAGRVVSIRVGTDSPIRRRMRPRAPLAWLARPATVAVVLLVAVLAVAGCGRDGDGDGEAAAASTTTAAAPTTTAPATTTTRDRQATDAAVLAAYRAYWDDVVAVGKTANWQSARLAEHATGQALETLRAHFRTMKRVGLIDLGTVKLRPKVATLRGRTAIVQDCIDVSRFLLHDATTRQPREQPDPKPDRGVATLTLTSDGWKVSKTVGRGKCGG